MHLKVCWCELDQNAVTLAKLCVALLFLIAGLIMTGVWCQRVVKRERVKIVDGLQMLMSH